MKKWIILTALVGIVALVAGLYTIYQYSPPRTGVTVVDQLGREVHIQKAERIISVWPEATRVLFALGVGNKIVGLDGHSATCPILVRAFPEVKNIAVVGKVGELSIEKMAELKPDLIFMYTDDPDLVERIQNTLSKPVVAVRFNPPGARDWSFHIITIIGTAVGKEERAHQLRTYLEEKLLKITRITSTIPESEKPKAYQAWAYDLFRTMVWSSEIIYGGGINVALAPQKYGTGVPWVTVSLEQIITWNPDVIILHGFGKWNPEDVLDDPGWQPINAVRNRRVYKLTMGWAGWDLAGIVIQTMQCAKVFHPGKFTDLDVEKEANEIFKLVYGVDGLYTRLKKDYRLSI